MSKTGEDTEAPTPFRPFDGNVALRPLGNPDIVGVASAQLVDEGTCREYRALVLADAPAPSAVADHLHPLVAQFVSIANEQHFHFALTDLSHADPTIVATTGAGETELMCDLGPATSTRKITWVLPLETGGEIGFPALGKERPLEAGVAVAFPSFLTYSLVTSTATSTFVLVGWAHGHHFR